MAYTAQPLPLGQAPTPPHVHSFLSARGWWFAGAYPGVGDVWSPASGAPPHMYPWHEAVAYEMASMFGTLEK